MKITPILLSIPPYISTTWSNISTLHVKPEAGGYRLTVVLKDESHIEIPALNKAEIDAIFEAHAQYAPAPAEINPLVNPIRFSLPLRTDGQIIDSLGASMKHDPDQADTPPLPSDVLEKISMVARAFGLDDTSALPSAEENCNCIYCQVVRTLKGEAKEPEEPVADADLTFRDWEISQTADKLYHVTNPLDKSEQYDVFLGSPLGCTCGQKNCEHVKAVLTS